MIDECDPGSRLHGEGIRREGEIVDLDLRRLGPGFFRPRRRKNQGAEDQCHPKRMAPACLDSPDHHTAPAKG